MKISTKGRYAVRMICYIAEHGSERAVPIKEISEHQGISLKYLEQIAILLVKAGLIKSVRGAQGGYKLTKSPDDYTVGMILRLTEGNIAPVACLEGESNQCERSCQCQTLFIWQRVYDAVCGVVDNITVTDIIEHGQKEPDAVQ